MVKAWKETVVIPTNEVGKPEKNPIFLENRVYQGSSGVVYPYPVIESISDKKVDKEYQAVWLENEYIKVMILPELGGRVQMAYDKIAKRHFIYYNQVIKPALVGLAGPWISGGIEFNWPQHHRPSTFMPVDCTIEESNDGSVTVWCNEMEQMFHQRARTGFVLRSGYAYLEIKGIVCNRSQIPQTFLWWANPAVHVNDEYQSVFPPDVNAVFDHGKRAVSTFPIATGVYYNMDYSAGVDISNYRNIYVPTSYMVAKSKYDFEGGYENDTKAGMLHVANRHVSPGKKQWTWGNGDFGRAWDRNLTDEDGPYIELMAGVFTENQPDFSWLMPGEEKSFIQYFFPYRELGVVKNASKDLVINLEKEGNDTARVKVFATSLRKVHISLRSDNGKILLDKFVELGPEHIFDETVDTFGTSFESLTLSADRLSWHPESANSEIPEPAKAALKPSEISTCEQLYLTGLHLEQYRHATWSALDYYEEALRRDPLDVRCNNAIGLWYIRRARFAKAEPFLRTAVKVLQSRNLNPYDGEPLYNLGLCLKYLGNKQEAYDWFYKSTWNAAWKATGFFACSQISTSEGRWEDALWEINNSLENGWHNHQARALKVAILRHLGRIKEAIDLINESLELDPFNYGCRFERILIDGMGSEDMTTLMRDYPHNYDEIALDYKNAGLYDEAEALWKLAEKQNALNIMSCYYWGRYDKAASMSTAYAFPNRLEAVAALENAPKEDSKAPFLLGNLWYDKRQYDLAIFSWEKSARLNPLFPTVWRNLALSYYNKQHNENKAVEAMEKAFSLDESDSRVFMELEQLYRKIGRSSAERLQLMDKYPSLVSQRDDLILEHITLLNDLERYEEAMNELDSHIFHPWEGGEGKVPAQYQRCRIELSKIAMNEGDYENAIRLLEECLVYPHHLGEGKLYCAQEQDLYYYLGRAWKCIGNVSKANECWEKASEGRLEPVPAIYYNDAPPEKIYFQGLSLYELGHKKEAKDKFEMLINYGKEHIDDTVVMDYFAVSLPDLAIWDEDLTERNKKHCKYMMELGEKGKAMLG